MESGNDVTLLSLTGYVLEHILSYLGGSKGGVQALLNLRLTCRATKSWTDDLPASCARQVFSNAQIRIKCESIELRCFLKSLPAKGINSLVLIEAHPAQNSDLQLLSEGEYQENIWWTLFDEFTAYWKGKLEHLEFINFPKTEIPKDRRILNFLQTPKSSFKCSALNNWGNEDSICHFLKHSDTLKRFETSLLKFDDLNLVTAILTERRNSTGFELVLKCRLSQQKVWNRELSRELFKTFTLAIINCACTVQLNDYSADYLNFLLKNELSDLEKRMFFRCIDSIYFESTGSNRFTLNELPNWKKLNFYQPWTSEAYAKLPPRLEVLCLGEIVDCPPYHFLPSVLNALKFHHATSSVNVFLTGMAALSSACPLLRNLHVTWKCSLKSEVNPTCIVIFPNLKHFTFNGTVKATNGRNVVNHIVKGLQIHSTPLHVLELMLETYEKIPSALLDEGTIRRFCEGKLGDSLLKYITSHEIKKGGPIAARLDIRLRNKIIMNRKRAKETVGLYRC